MTRALAALLALLIAPCAALAETRVFTFPWQSPPAALTATAMAVAEGETVVTLTFGGDCTLGGTPFGGARRFASHMEAKGYAYPFSGLAALLRTDDLSLVNLEGVLSDQSLKRVKKQYNFKGKTDYAAILTEGGVECVTLTNNHTLDYGEAGYRDTTAALDSAGVAYVDDAHGVVLEKNGVRVGFTASGLRFDEKAFLAHAAQLRALGCTAIVHVMHMGEEYADTLTAGQTRAARFVAENGALLVVGHHPHVAQGLAVIGQTTVAYSLGNCVFGGNTAPRDYDAYLLRATLRFTDGVPTQSQATLWPIRISGAKGQNDYRPVLLTGEDAGRVLDKAQATSSFTLAPFVDGQGAMQAPVTLP